MCCCAYLVIYRYRSFRLTTQHLYVIHHNRISDTPPHPYHFSEYEIIFSEDVSLSATQSPTSNTNNPSKSPTYVTAETALKTLTKISTNVPSEAPCTPMKYPSKSPTVNPTMNPSNSPTYSSTYPTKYALITGPINICASMKYVNKYSNRLPNDRENNERYSICKYMPPIKNKNKKDILLGTLNTPSMSLKYYDNNNENNNINNTHIDDIFERKNNKIFDENIITFKYINGILINVIFRNENNEIFDGNATEPIKVGVNDGISDINHTNDVSFDVSFDGHYDIFNDIKGITFGTLTTSTGTYIFSIKTKIIF